MCTKQYWFIGVLLCGCSSIQTSESELTKAEENGQNAEFREALSREVQEEVAIGREMASKLLGLFGAYEADGVTLEYVNLVGLSLAQRVGRPEIQYRFGILKSGELNAFATPGGYIFITSALLGAVKDESELAAILAHEIAHVNERHMYREIAPKRNVSASETVARIMSRGHSDLGRSLSMIANKGIKMLLDEGLGAEKEREADEAGVLYASSAGYWAPALTDFLKRVNASRNTLNLSKIALPLPPRISYLENFVREQGLTQSGDAKSTVMNERFKRALANLPPS